MWCATPARLRHTPRPSPGDLRPPNTHQKGENKDGATDGSLRGNAARLCASRLPPAAGAKSLNFIVLDTVNFVKSARARDQYSHCKWTLLDCLLTMLSEETESTADERDRPDAGVARLGSRIAAASNRIIGFVARSSRV